MLASREIKLAKFAPEAFVIPQKPSESKEMTKKHISDDKEAQRLGPFFKAAEYKYIRRMLEGFLR